MNKRITNLISNFEKSNIDAMIISKPQNLYYLSNFTGDSGVLLITPSKTYLLTDARFTIQAHTECTDVEVVEITNKNQTLSDLVKSNSVKSLGFEEHYLTYEKYSTLKTNYLYDIVLTPLNKLVENIRIIKEPDEIEKIANAQALGCRAFEHILQFIKPGVIERDIANELEYFMKKNSASSTSFDTIVASGLRSAMAHGVASNKKIENGDTIVLDFGCILDHYCSDMTRTVFVGEVSETMKKVYNIVKDAQQFALDNIEASITCSNADALARNIIVNNGYGDQFGHSLGHGVGLEIHEAPVVSSKNIETLIENMCVTVEPGIYLENMGGVRIEDLVVIQNGAAKNLSQNATKELIIL